MQRSSLNRKVKEHPFIVGPLHHQQASASIACLSGIAPMYATTMLANVINQAIPFACIFKPVTENAFVFLGYVN